MKPSDNHSIDYSCQKLCLLFILSYRVLDQLYKQEKNNVEMLKKELKFHKELEKEAVGAREEAKMLRNKLACLRNVELMVNGIISAKNLFSSHFMPTNTVMLVVYD